MIRNFIHTLLALVGTGAILSLLPTDMLNSDWTAALACLVGFPAFIGIMVLLGHMHS